MTARHLSLILSSSMVLAACGQTPSAPAASATTAMSTLAVPGTDVLEADGTESDIKTDKAALYRAISILGIGPVYAEALRQAGVENVMHLLENGHTRTGRERLARKTGISTKLLLTWVNHADLMRMTRTGPVYARLLEEAGVDTVAELARRDARNLRPTLESAHIKGGFRLSDRIPSVTTLNVWISRARALGRYVEY
ncbi:MAG: DUF4332 domain-containing protein [Candidatus Sericytochromatia bacterium]|nr:DUF4332 domain-containing protein [Candidatus Tanganyikabacteria bacterium]